MPAVRWLRSVVVASALACAAAPATAADSAEAGGGFRLNPRPKVVDVFGDATRYRAHVDRFFTLADEMAVTRARFSSDVQLVLAGLVGSAAVIGKRVCPVDVIAPAVARAVTAGEAYQAQGRELEVHAQAIARLAALGEQAGLTPDYRWRVSKAARLYPELLRDWREMRTAFARALTAELTYAGCTLATLVARGEALSGGAKPTTPLGPLVIPRPKANPRDIPPPPASAPIATFTIDNTRCPSATRVVVDDQPLGQVAGGATVSFRTTAGRHGFCLLAEGKTCGDPGTRRAAYIHEGFTVALRCD